MVTTYPSKVSIITAMQNHVCYKAPVLIGGTVEKKGIRVTYYTGGFSIVFKFMNSNNGPIAVRCWCADVGEPQKRTQTISAFLRKLKSAYFVNFEYINDALLIDGEYNPIVIMDWAEGDTLKDYLRDNITKPKKILALADKFLEMVGFFHKNQIAHGDLQHGNIKVTDKEDLVVLDYDGMYVNGLDGMQDNIKGYPGYQHPARQRNRFIHSKLDYFSELVIYLSLLVYAEYYESKKELWNYKTDYLVFSKEDFESPNTSETMNFLRKSTNAKISNLTFKLIDCLKYVNITDLEPLEKMIEDDELDKIANDIIRKFQN